MFFKDFGSKSCVGSKEGFQPPFPSQCSLLFVFFFVFLKGGGGGEGSKIKARKAEMPRCSVFLKSATGD